MKRPALLLPILLCCSAAANSDAPKRPRILGIRGVSIAAPQDKNGFYTKQLGFNVESVTCGGVCDAQLGVNSHQGIGLINRPPTDPAGKPSGNYLIQVMFETPDAEALHRYLEASGLHPGEILNSNADDAHPSFSLFSLTDPEGHNISFVQVKGRDLYRHSDSQTSQHIIHAGFVVRDRAATDHFYKDILGFRPYWHGGMKDDKDDWVAMQVPDGTDWVEYMLNIPLDADKKLLGVMNHIALGVTDIQATKAQLLKNGATLTEEPKLGRDGKWQLNLYDPDQTRIEFMEFTPKEKPCCSEFTGPHPKP